jgi:hypothetical protein
MRFETDKKLTRKFTRSQNQKGANAVFQQGPVCTEN